MKKLLSALLITFMVVSSASFTSFANGINEPTTEELEAIIKIVKPKLEVPVECSEFSWRFNAKSAYNDAGWRLIWETGDDSEKNMRVQVNCDIKGNITSFTFNDYDKKYGQLPEYSKQELQSVADDFISKTVHDASENVILENLYSSGIYSGQFNYQYVRYIDGYIFPDNYINVAVDYNTGKVVQMNVDYDYELDIDKPESIITPEKAEEILGSCQKMELTYLTRTETDENTNERTIKAFLVYRPTTSYLAVDAGTGEIYDTKSEWSVNDKLTAGGAVVENGVMMDKAETEESGDDYRLTDEELAGLQELEGLISKEEAIKAVTENEYLYLNPALTAVYAELSKNYSAEKTAAYQNENGSYIWYINFSNPVIEDKYYGYAYADASVNAETGELISFSCNLNDYYYYSENKLDIPEVKYDADKSRAVAVEFLKKYANEKFENTVEGNYNASNVISRIEEAGVVTQNIYGAHNFQYTRVNENVKFARNYLNVGVDGVTGKIYNFNSNWWTNVEFESPNGAMTPENALHHLISNDGYGVIYERNVTHIYTPVTESSKKDICVAFVSSLFATAENSGDIQKVIDKFASNIDREKLVVLLQSGDENDVLEFVCGHFGITVDEVQETVKEYVDTSLFYDKDVAARLVYTCYDLGSTYVSPFTGKLLNSRGEEYKETVSSYSYDDLVGHWIEQDALLLADIAVGFEGGKFMPDKPITDKEFAKISQAISFYTPVEENDIAITRIKAIKLIIDSLGYEKVAKLKGIYKTDFADNSTIKEEDLGYISIASGFGIINGDGKNINAYSVLTRAEAVRLLLNAVKSAR